MNKAQLTDKAKALKIDVAALNAANKKGLATNKELREAIIDAEEKLPKKIDKPEQEQSSKDAKRELRINGKKK